MNYGTTHAELATTPPARSWQMLRSLRHSPPGRANRGDRKETFNAALEQSEQFMTAARSVGVATRPVPLFYAVSQAAWAINAASTMRSGNDWRLGGGHGITVRNLSTMTGSLACLALQDNGKGSFTAMAETLRAASLPEETPLGDLWCLLPDAHQAPLPDQGAARLLSLDAQNSSNIRGGRTLAVLSGLPGHLSRNTGGEEAPDWAAEREDVLSYLDQYPTLTDVAFHAYPGQPIGLQWRAPDDLMVRVMLGESTTHAEERADIANRTHEWSGFALAYPSVGGSALPSHPFLLWWATLFALSQLARYEPKAWLARTSISSSSDAAPIEHLLDRALATVPELIHRTITEAAQDQG